LPPRLKNRNFTAVKPCKGRRDDGRGGGESTCQAAAIGGSLLRGGVTAFRAFSLKVLHGAPRPARVTPAAARRNALTQQLKSRSFLTFGAAQERINGCVFFTQHLAEIARKGL